MRKWITVIEPEGYLAQVARAGVPEAERDAIVETVARDPECGTVIPDTGGLRKVRVLAKGHGKRGGARVIYYFLWDTVPVILLAYFSKNEKVDLTPKERKALKKFVTELKKALKEEP